MTREEALHWLYAIETFAEYAYETRAWEVHDDCLEWYAAVQDGAFRLDDSAERTNG